MCDSATGEQKGNNALKYNESVVNLCYKVLIRTQEAKPLALFLANTCAPFSIIWTEQPLNWQLCRHFKCPFHSIILHTYTFPKSLKKL